MDSKINKFSTFMSCKIIPVVDLRNGVVVRAVAGDRANYKQLDNAAFKSNDLCRIIEVLLKLSRSNILYVANLNGIAGDDSYDGILYEIMRKFWKVEIWVDNGFKDLEELRDFNEGFSHWCKQKGYGICSGKNLVPVFGTETITDNSSYKKIFSTLDEAVLSIDKKNNVILGLVTIDTILGLLPKRVILMNLDKVGTDSGPDLSWLKNMTQKNLKVEFFGAGGLRDLDDYEIVARYKAAGWLVGSALFNFMIDFGDE